MRRPAGGLVDVVAHRSPRFVLVAVVALATLAQAGITRADPAEVEALISEGNQLRREGQGARALALFQKAHALAHTPRTEAQLGLAEMDVGYYVEAETHIASALEFPKHPFISSNRAPLEKALAHARKQIGELAIDGAPAGATVTVNGRQVGTLPLASPVRLAAGRAEIEIAAPGHASFWRSVALRGGERQQVTAKLEKTKSSSETSPTTPGAGPQRAAAPPLSPPPGVELATGAGAGAPSPSPLSTASIDEPPPTSGLRVAAWVTAGSAAAALGVGIAFHLAARAAVEDLNASCMPQDNQFVPKAITGSMVTIKTCQGLHDSWNTDKRWSIAGYAVGGALAITSAILFWQSHPAPRADATSHASFHCTPTLSAFSCGGEF